jgi:hypothetical protein
MVLQASVLQDHLQRLAGYKKSAYVHIKNVITKTLKIKSRDSSLGMMGYELDGQGSIPGRGKNFLHSVQTGFEAHPAFYPMGTGVVDHSSPSQCRNQEWWSYSSTPRCLRGVFTNFYLL